jgi:hypothetical protein
MATRPIVSVANDFSNVVTLLKRRGILSPNPAAATIGTARKIHGYTYSLILWRFRLRGLPDHGRVFIEEIASDALQILPQVLLGYSKTAKLLVRGIAENTLRHIYFSDHPIEFLRMNREGKWYLTIDQLCEYAKTHPAFWKIERKFDAINQISSLYSQLSAGVHGRAVRDLEMRVALEKLVYDEGLAAREAECLRKCAEASNFLLAIFYHQKLRSGLTFQAEDRRIILRTMPPRARQLWTDYE